MTRQRLKEWSIAGAVILVIALSIFQLQRYNDRTAEEIQREKWIPKAEKITPEIVLLQQYVQIDTSNPPGNEGAGAAWLVQQLTGAGVQPVVIESAPGRASVYARLKGTRSGEGLLLLHHIDVVPPGSEKWTHPPFAGDIRFNLMFGRGTLDMKGIGICQLRAFLDVARSGKPPLRDIVFLAVADEETGGELGMQWIIRNRPDMLDGVRYALNEGGVTETKLEEVTYFGIEVGTKQVIETTLSASSREALQRARISLEPYFVMYEPERVTEEVRRFLRYLAPHRIENAWMLADIDRSIAEGRFWLLPPGYRELTQNVVWAAGIEESNGAHAMDAFLFNIPGEDPDERLRWLEEQVAPYGVRVAVKRKDPVAPISSELTPLFALLRREIHRQYGPVAVGTKILNNAQTDSRFLRPRGITCYGIWPFPVDFTQTLGIHGHDERIRLDWFTQGVELTRKVVWAYAFEPEEWEVTGIVSPATKNASQSGFPGRPGSR